jgi:hypothetical protein
MSELISAEQRLHELAIKMQHHDWHYSTNTDHAARLAGESKIRWITGETKYLYSLGLEREVQALWEQHCPWTVQSNTV